MEIYQPPEEHAHCLIFSSASGARYLFDAATTTVHPWPWALVEGEVEALYAADDRQLAGMAGDGGLPPELARYVATWRRHAGAFGGQAGTAGCGSCGVQHAEATSGAAPSIELLPSLFGNLMLIVTDACNLRCRYCIFSESYADFHSYRPANMSWDTARQAVDYFFSLNDQPAFKAIPRRKINIVFFGGEPLLAGDLIRQVVAYAKAQARPHYRLDFSMTSNLTHLPDDLAEFLVENYIGVDVSIDGPALEHDRYRRDVGDRGTFGRIYQNLQKLHRLSPSYFGERVRVVATLTGNSDLLAVRDFFESGDPFIPRVGFVNFVRDMRVGDFHQRYPYDPERLARQFGELLREYYARKRLGQPVEPGDFLYQMFEDALRSVYRRTMPVGSYNGCASPNTCSPGRRIAVGTDGQFHLCERINEYFPIGDVEHGLDWAACREVQAQYRSSLPDCNTCWARGVCQACFAHVCNYNQFDFSQRRCDEMRALFALHLSSLYTVLEDAPDGLLFNDRMMDRCLLTEERL